MAITQIIGPRIKPMWADPVEWTSTRAYDADTYVTYHGDSYATRQPTPIGIQITNKDYWVKVSEFNAQAVAMQNSVNNTLEANETAMQNMLTEGEQKINDSVAHVDAVAKNLQDSIQTLRESKANKTKCVMIGNSFTVGYYTHNYGMGKALQDMHYFDDIWWFTSDGSGFTNHESKTGGKNITDKNNFLALVNQAAASTEFDNDSIETVIFNSAMGDTRAVIEGKTNIETSIVNTVNRARTVFPNATIYIVYSEQILHRNTQQAYGLKYPMAQMRTHYIFQNLCRNMQNNARVVYIGWCGYPYNLFWGNSATDNTACGFMPDGYHPTEYRSIQLADNMLNMMCGYSPVTAFINAPNEAFYPADTEPTAISAPNIFGSSPETFQMSHIPIYVNEVLTTGAHDAKFILSEGASDYSVPVVPFINGQVHSVNMRDKNGTDNVWFHPTTVFMKSRYDDSEVLHIYFTQIPITAASTYTADWFVADIQGSSIVSSNLNFYAV